MSLWSLKASLLKIFLARKLSFYPCASLHCCFYFCGFEWMAVACVDANSHTHTDKHTLSSSQCRVLAHPRLSSWAPTSPLPLSCWVDWIYAVHAAWSWWSWQLWFLSQWISFASQQPPPHREHPPPPPPSFLPPYKCSGLWLTPTPSLTHSFTQQRHIAESPLIRRFAGLGVASRKKVGRWEQMCTWQEGGWRKPKLDVRCEASVGNCF